MIVTKRVRIVHSPAEDKFQVQYKTWLLGLWHNDEQFAYRKVDQLPEHYRSVYTQIQAHARAHGRAAVLLEREVIFDGRK